MNDKLMTKIKQINEQLKSIHSVKSDLIKRELLYILAEDESIYDIQFDSQKSVINVYNKDGNAWKLQIH